VDKDLGDAVVNPPLTGARGHSQAAHVTLIKSELQQVIAYVHPARRPDGTQIKRRQLGSQHVENLAASAMAAIEYRERELERHVREHASWTQLIAIAHGLSSRIANIESILTTRPTNGTQNHEYSEAS
jgi:response regulator RpfG family c-di-GMP phosphodiesterase